MIINFSLFKLERRYLKSSDKIKLEIVIKVILCKFFLVAWGRGNKHFFKALTYPPFGTLSLSFTKNFPTAMAYVSPIGLTPTLNDPHDIWLVVCSKK